MRSEEHAMLTLALFPLGLVVERSALVAGPRNGQCPTTVMEQPLDMRSGVVAHVEELVVRV